MRSYEPARPVPGDRMPLPTGETVEIFGVRMAVVPRPAGPARPPSFSAAATFDALEQDCDRMLRQVVVGIVLVALALAFWLGDAAPAAADDGGRATAVRER